MRRILDGLHDFEGSLQPLQKDRWTVVVPAAGRGTRLGFHTSKVLFPLLERPLIEWTVDAMRSIASQFVFVLAPDHRDQVEPVLRRILPDGSFRIAIQSEPKGMADAVKIGLAEARTEFVAVVWGDQVALRRETVEACARIHHSIPGLDLTLPTVERDQPYIQFVRDADGRVVKVLQAREGEIQDPRGESDCGLFFFTRQRLQAVLDEGARQKARGAATGEFNLLPLLPRFESGAGTVITYRGVHADETVGVNTLADAEQVAAILRRRPAWSA